MKKPISPLAHGIIDYALIAALFTVPAMLKINDKAKNVYRLLGANLGAYNAVTDHGASIKPLIPFETHYKIDHFNIAFVTLLAFQKNIRKDKTALLFHTAFLSVAFMNLLLTDDNEKSNPDGGIS